MTQTEINQLQAAFVAHMKQKHSTKEGRADTLRTLVIHVKKEMMETNQRIVSDTEAKAAFLKEVENLLK